MTTAVLRPANQPYQFQKVKSEIHQRLVERMDLSRLRKLEGDDLRLEIRGLAESAALRAGEISPSDRERLVGELMDELFGLGPLERFLADPTVTDILVNDARTVYIERHGRLELTDAVFADDAHLMRIIQRAAARVGRRIDEANPLVDARLPDGSRLNAVVPPLALDGPALSIRRFGHRPLRMDDLKANGSLPDAVARFLAAAVEARVSMLISGGAGAGKTTLLNALSAFVPAGERIVTVEDSAELILQNRHRVRLETRPPNTEGAGAILQRELVRNALRMRPDRIVVGEVRGAEVWDMLQAMNTGHEGSLTTVHANSAPDALARLEMMVAMTGFELPVHVVRQHIALGVRLIAHVSRLKGGVRRLVQVAEIRGINEGSFQVQDIFVFRQQGLDANGTAIGEFSATGYVPQCLERFVQAGVSLPDDLFSARPLTVSPGPL